MKSQIDVTTIGPLFWDLMALQDLLAAIETIDAIDNAPKVINILLFVVENSLKKSKTHNS
jgi:hypothetical protein